MYQSQICLLNIVTVIVFFIKGQNIIFYYKIGKNVAIESNFEVLLGNLRCRKLCG
jgi:hypothetical protein